SLLVARPARRPPGRLVAGAAAQPLRPAEALGSRDLGGPPDPGAAAPRGDEPLHAEGLAARARPVVPARVALGPRRAPTGPPGFGGRDRGAGAPSPRRRGRARAPRASRGGPPASRRSRAARGARPARGVGRARARCLARVARGADRRPPRRPADPAAFRR